MNSPLTLLGKGLKSLFSSKAEKKNPHQRHARTRSGIYTGRFHSPELKATARCA